MFLSSQINSAALLLRCEGDHHLPVPGMFSVICQECSIIPLSHRQLICKEMKTKPQIKNNTALTPEYKQPLNWHRLRW